MVMKLYIATSNPGKLRDFAAVAGAHVSLEPLPGLAEIPVPPEDAPTFEGNARAKAIFYSRHAPGAIVLADDSGLEVDALDGDPGVRSARYADDRNYPASEGDTTDERNNACLLQALMHVLEGSRQARYRCALAAARDGQVIQIADGFVEGEILNVPRGTLGFGYDPLFFLPQYQKTMAELDAATKLAFSHRGNALRALLATLNLSLER
jgi:XTP/dITP diphosphohydrolase